MLKYRGFDIPETKEEMVECSKLTPAPGSFPCVVLYYRADNISNLRVTTRISIEDVLAADESTMENIIDEFKNVVNRVTSFICKGDLEHGSR